MNIQDKLTMPRGEVSIKVFRVKDDIKELIDVIDGFNTVVDNTKDAILRLLAEADGDKQIVSIVFGDDNGAITTADQYDSFSNPYLKDLSDNHVITTTPSRTLTFNWSLQAYEYNGYTVRSIGLVFADGTLATKKLLGTEVAKDYDIILEGSWVLSI